MSENCTEYLHSKLTRGDKCIIIHVAVTLLLILVLVIIYGVHILMVDHEGYGYFKITRRTLGQSSEIDAVDLRLEVPDYSSVGVAYINASPARIVCNIILIRQSWSLAPAHCVTIRSDPELSQLLPKWKLKYKDVLDKETDIKKGLVHSFYNRDDFDNNIGLFEHFDQIPITAMTFPDKILSDLLKGNTENLVIIGWSKVAFESKYRGWYIPELKGTQTGRALKALDELRFNPVHLIKNTTCSQFVAPIVDAPRKYELCVQARDKSRIEGAHGGALVLNSQIVGFFSWGDRSGSVPQVVLAIEPYKSWLDSMMAMNL